MVVVAVEEAEEVVEEEVVAAVEEGEVEGKAEQRGLKRLRM